MLAATLLAMPAVASAWRTDLAATPDSSRPLRVVADASDVLLAGRALRDSGAQLLEQASLEGRPRDSATGRGSVRAAATPSR